MIDLGALQAEFGYLAARAASQSASNRVARIVSLSPAGGYDVEYSTGAQSRNVGSHGVQRWKVGDWVTVEMAGGRPIIVGIATGAAGA